MPVLFSCKVRSVKTIPLPKTPSYLLRSQTQHPPSNERSLEHDSLTGLLLWSPVELLETGLGRVVLQPAAVARYFQFYSCRKLYSQPKLRTTIVKYLKWAKALNTLTYKNWEGGRWIGLKNHLTQPSYILHWLYREPYSYIAKVSKHNEIPQQSFPFRVTVPWWDRKCLLSLPWKQSTTLPSLSPKKGSVTFTLKMTSTTKNFKPLFLCETGV